MDIDRWIEYNRQDSLLSDAAEQGLDIISFIAKTDWSEDRSQVQFDQVRVFRFNRFRIQIGAKQVNAHKSGS